mmetsp:Transcript_102263/g.218920  ORF Transcript_102263/g.218920 Transcript_102263/m.218920 type:complete len:269 (+) Transcript_102263:42-848(+)
MDGAFWVRSIADHMLQRNDLSLALRVGDATNAELASLLDVIPSQPWVLQELADLGTDIDKVELLPRPKVDADAAQVTVGHSLRVLLEGECLVETVTGSEVDLDEVIRWAWESHVRHKVVVVEAASSLHYGPGRHANGDIADGQAIAFARRVLGLLCARVVFDGPQLRSPSAWRLLAHEDVPAGRVMQLQGELAAARGFCVLDDEISAQCIPKHVERIRRLPDVLHPKQDLPRPHLCWPPRPGSAPQLRRAEVRSHLVFGVFLHAPAPS